MRTGYEITSVLFCFFYVLRTFIHWILMLALVMIIARGAYALFDLTDGMMGLALVELKYVLFGCTAKMLLILAIRFWGGMESGNETVYCVLSFSFPSQSEYCAFRYGWIGVLVLCFCFEGSCTSLVGSLLALNY